ncbi:MAG TPA: kinase [Marinobacter sp.]|uniref:Kinase n=2 Tax=root TaxID=1 RepID=A0A831W154_9GAMM|nr:kinase [Marinobacter antarcticus]HDZ38515.1 kinase [Marinobacter sp.]HEA54015.1 kinase [Marinobacter antarcticus]
MSQNDALYTIRSLFVTALIAIGGTVLVLELSGGIKHSDNKDHIPVGDFQAIHITEGETFRMSPKASELHAVCENGYLAIAADVDPSFMGILVDYKNRGVRCYQPSPNDPAVLPQPDEQAQPDQQQEPASDQ